MHLIPILRIRTFFLVFFLTGGLTAQQDYFPPLAGTAWDKTDPATLGWCSDAIQRMDAFLEERDTKSYIVLKDGKIVLERYFGTFTRDSVWYWASAGKTVTALLVGIAQSEGKLSVNNSTSVYLSKGWTSLPEEQEKKITVWHQLTMTSGLDDGIADKDCTLPSCLVRKADPGTRWAYHNAPYTLLEKVVESATGKTYNQYFQEKIRNKTGMNGLWIKLGYNNVYVSNTRSMARFGLLLLNKGNWAQTPLLSDTSWYRQQIQPSQNLNPSYGYLTWLNGQERHMLPGSQFVFQGSMVRNAPADMYAALGRDDQKIYVIPSRRMVVVRMGDDAGLPGGINSFDNEFWQYLEKLPCETSTEEPSIADISIFPNPAGREDNPVIRTMSEASVKTVKVYDVSGRLLSLSSPSGDHQMPVACCQEAGIYFIECTDNNGHTMVKRLVRL